MCSTFLPSSKLGNFFGFQYIQTILFFGQALFQVILEISLNFFKYFLSIIRTLILLIFVIIDWHFSKRRNTKLFFCRTLYLLQCSVHNPIMCNFRRSQTRRTQEKKRCFPFLRCQTSQLIHLSSQNYCSSSFCTNFFHCYYLQRQ